MSPDRAGAVVTTDRALWGAVLVTMAADVLLTVHGIRNGAAEGNPVARLFIGTLGLVAGLLALKAITLSFGVAGWRLTSGWGARIVPIGLTVPTALAVLVNATVLFA